MISNKHRRPGSVQPFIRIRLTHLIVRQDFEPDSGRETADEFETSASHPLGEPAVAGDLEGDAGEDAVGCADDDGEDKGQPAGPKGELVRDYPGPEGWQRCGGGGGEVEDQDGRAEDGDEDADADSEEAEEPEEDVEHGGGVMCFGVIE